LTWSSLGNGFWDWRYSFVSLELVSISPQRYEAE
jgi:hypothetical protein